MRKGFISVLSMLILGTFGLSIAQEVEVAPEVLPGKISVISDGSITTIHKKWGRHVYKTDGNTQVIKVDGTPGTIADLTIGILVKVASTATGEATKITIFEAKKSDPAAQGESAQ